MKGFSNRFRDFPDYIIQITKEIWEDRGVATLNHYYAEDIPVRTPMGVEQGNQPVIVSTLATLAEFPDRELLAEDVIYSDDPEHGLLSSHRIITRATHSHDGQFGPASGKSFTVRVIADCAAKEDTIYDEWLVRDYGGIVRQLGMEPRAFAARLIEAEGGAAAAAHPFTPEMDIEGAYKGRGNDNEWGAKYAGMLTRIMEGDAALILTEYDRAAIGEYPGARTAVGRDRMSEFWVGLRAAFPNATFTLHHQIGMEADMLPPRAAIRWSLDGLHEGWGAFGRPTGARVHVMGMSHAEFGPWGLRRECTLYDEIAIWKQILLHTG
ncbi:MAG: ester cyclase [Silicimonas sp.]|nr:ester cyclase [Silicimonas sp.]